MYAGAPAPYKRGLVTRLTLASLEIVDPPGTTFIPTDGKSVFASRRARRRNDDSHPSLPHRPFAASSASS
jgi:hypothetical protein